MPKEVYRDTGLLEGTHHGGNSASALYDPNVHFEITDAVGRLLANTTQGTSGLVTGQTLNTATATGVTWNSGDAYILYVGATAGATLSSTWICRKCGIAHPRRSLVNDEHPDCRDIPRRTMDVKG